MSDPEFIDAFSAEEANNIDMAKYKLLACHLGIYHFQLRAKPRLAVAVVPQGGSMVLEPSKPPKPSHKATLEAILVVMRSLTGNNHHRPVHSSEMMPLLTITGDELYDLLTELERAGEIFQPSRGYWALI